MNQFWVLEIVRDQAGDPSTGPGAEDNSAAANPIYTGFYNIVNRVTNADATISAGATNATSVVQVWPALGATRTNNTRRWRVIPVSKDTLKITYTLVPVNSLRFLKPGPYISAGESICRIVPVANSPYFHIALGTADNAVYLQDHNNAGASNLNLSTAAFSKDDRRQQWQFVYISP